MREDWIDIEIDIVAEVNPKKPQADDDLEVTFLPMPLVEEETGRYHLKETRKFSQVKKGYTGFIEGDVLFAKITPCMENGKIAVINNLLNSIGFGSTEFHVLRPSFAIEKKYLFYFLVQKGFRGYAQRKMTGSAGQLRVPKNILESAKIPIAPLPEQRAIVAKIEQLFSELDNGIANLKAAKDKLEIYRQAVLKKAFEGECKIVKLNSVVDVLSQGWSPKCKNESSSNEEEWAVIKTSAIQHGDFVESENKILSENLEPRKQHEIMVGDILITRAGPRSRVGVCCLVKQTRPRLINCDKVYRLRLSERILNDYFMYKMNSSEFLNKIEEIKTGGNDSGVNLTQNRFLNLELGLPPVEIQKQIIKEIESRLSVCDKVEQNIAEGLEKSEALRQSILKKAFEGKLLSEVEIEKCKQEADYEPASVLLEKIKKEKGGE